MSILREGTNFPLGKSCNTSATKGLGSIACWHGDCFGSFCVCDNGWMDSSTLTIVNNCSQPDVWVDVCGILALGLSGALAFAVAVSLRDIPESEKYTSKRISLLVLCAEIWSAISGIALITARYAGPFFWFTKAIAASFVMGATIKYGSALRDKSLAATNIPNETGLDGKRDLMFQYAPLVIGFVNFFPWGMIGMAGAAQGLPPSITTVSAKEEMENVDMVAYNRVAAFGMIFSLVPLALAVAVISASDRIVDERVGKILAMTKDGRLPPNPEMEKSQKRYVKAIKQHKKIIMGAAIGAVCIGGPITIINLVHNQIPLDWLFIFILIVGEPILVHTYVWPHLDRCRGYVGLLPRSSTSNSNSRSTATNNRNTHEESDIPEPTVQQSPSSVAAAIYTDRMTKSQSFDALDI